MTEMEKMIYASAFCAGMKPTPEYRQQPGTDSQCATAAMDAAWAAVQVYRYAAPAAIAEGMVGSDVETRYRETVPR